MSRGALVTAKARNALKEINQDGNKLALARDYVAQAYMGHWGGAATVEKVRSRVHWIAAEARGARVLDVGTSEGIVPILLGREGFHVVGIDISAEAIDYANQLLEQEPEAVRERISFRPISLFQQEETPQFDTVIMGEVIEHVSNVESFVSRALQTLAPGGRLILTTPFGVHPDRDHKHTFFISDMQALFASRGRIESLTVVDGYIRLLFRNEEPAAAQEQLPALALPDVLALTEEATFASQSLLWRQIDQAGQRIEALQAQMEAAQQQAAKSDAARREQETALQEAGRELAELQERLRSADAAVEARKGELAEQRAALEERGEEARRAREEAAEWQARCDALQQKLRHLETDLVRAREQQTASQETLAARDTAIQALEAAQAQRESELAAAREEAAAAVERLAERERELAELKSSLAAQQETLAAAQARLAEQAQQLAEQEEILTEWAEECERLEGERRAAEARAAEHEQRLADAEALHADAQERLEAREAQAGEQAAELEELRRQVAERDAEVRRLSQALAAAEAAGRDLAQTQARLAKAEAERQETARRLQEQQGLAAQRAQELEGLRKQLSDLEAKAKSQAEALARAQAAERAATERLAEREKVLSAAEARLAEQSEALDGRARELETAQAARARLESEAGGLRTRLEAASRQQRETARELASLKAQAAQQLTVLEGGERLRWVEPLLALFRRMELDLPMAAEPRSRFGLAARKAPKDAQKLALAPRKLADLCTEIAKENYRDDPFAMLLLASLADALDPQPARRKWLGFRLLKADLPDAAERVLAPLQGKMPFSPSEQKAWEELTQRPKSSQCIAVAADDVDTLSVETPKVQGLGTAQTPVAVTKTVAEADGMATAPLDAGVERKDYPTANRLYNERGNISDALQIMESLEARGTLKGITPRNLLLKLRGLARLSNGYILPPRQLSSRPVSKSKQVLYCLHQSVPYTTNGYSTRSHGVALGLQNAGLSVRAMTRVGFPWDAGVKGLDGERQQINVDGITYLTVNGPHLSTSPLDEYLNESADEFAREAEACKAEIIVAASNHITALPALMAARRLGLPYVYEVRGLWEVTQASIQPEWAHSERYQLMRKLEQQAALEADLVITLTEELADELASWGVPRERIEVVPNAVNTELFHPMAADTAIAEELKLKPGVPVIGYAGSAVAYEGLELLMEAMATLKRKGQPFTFVLVGDGKVIDTVKAKAKELDIDGECRFTGRVPFEEVPRYLSCMDILPIPRLSSAVTEMVSALKPLEAMAMGKAVVLSDVSPHTTMAGPNGERARLFRKDSAEALSNALQTLIDSPEERKRLGQAARSWVEHKRTWKHVSNRYAVSIDGVINDASKLRASVTNRSSGSRNPAKNLLALSILDEISEECWRHEFKHYLISRNKYCEQVEASKADFCFIESCWNGNKGGWQYAFTSPGLKHRNSKALLDLLPKVKAKMPILFWNKEDPMHYDKFLPIAKYADVIFTTDANKISEYKRDVPGAKVYAVPFAAQQKICNPSGRFRSEPESVCFAGSYYSVGHEERKRQMHALLPSIVEFKGAIYDRFSKLDNDRYKFPREFEPYIRGSVPFDEVVNLYKRFKVFLNVNTIVDSPTMMSRRVYELLACGTPVVSTPSRAMEEQFPDIVHMANDAREANKIIEKLLADDHYWDRTSHLGYREVMKKHTYAHRYQEIRKSLGYAESRPDPLVSIVTCTKRPHMSERLVENVARQSHENIELIVWVQDFLSKDVEKLKSLLQNKVKNAKRIEVVEDNSDQTLGQRFNAAAALAKGDYLAKMDDDDFYFKHYLSDMLIPFTFGDYAMVGKREVFTYLSESNKLIRRFPGQRHMEFNFVAGPTFIIKKSIFDKVGFEDRNTGEDSAFLKELLERNYKVYAADPFNFIQYRGPSANHTWGRDDEYFISNPQVKVEKDHFCTDIVDI